jgi:hypothetical protein
MQYEKVFRHPLRAYAKEAIDCYFAGAYRASIVSITITQKVWLSTRQA